MLIIEVTWAWLLWLIPIAAVTWLIVGAVQEHTKRVERWARREVADNLLAIDPTLLALGKKKVRYDDYKYYASLDLDEIQRLANLQRTRDKHNKDYTDLNEAKKRLDNERKEH